MRRLTQGVLSPDLTILLKADPRVTAGRGDFGQERFDKIEFQTSVAEIMGRLCKEAPPGAGFGRRRLAGAGSCSRDCPAGRVGADSKVDSLEGK